MRDQNKRGCFIRLEVADLENKRFCIFIPKGRGAKGGWVSMVEMLWRLGFTNEEEGCQKEEALLSKPSMGKTYAEVAKQPKGKEKATIRVEIRKKELSRNLNKLAHCLVRIWNPSSVREDDLRSWGTYLANFWRLKGNLGLAKLERGKVLLDFEFLAEAEKALKIGGISVGGSLLCLEKWRPELGCLMDGEKRSKAWVHIVGLPVSLWDRAILRRIGEECGGFLTVDSQTEKLGDLQWAKILVKLNGEKLPNVVEVWAEDLCYEVTLWWEVRLVLRAAMARKSRNIVGTEGEVGGEAIERAVERVRGEDDGSRLEDLLRPTVGIRGQTSG